MAKTHSFLKKGFEFARGRKKKIDELKLILRGDEYMDRDLYDSIQISGKE